MNRTTLKSWIPPALWDAVRLRLVGDGWRGDFADWDAAAAVCERYDDAGILDTVRRATDAVLAGEAPFERDAVLLDHPEPPWPVVTLLQSLAARNGSVSVVDFGGSLGSVYRQVRPFLPDDLVVRWMVVEQEHFVTAGQEAYTTDELTFHFTIAEAAAAGPVDVALFSSVVQYLPDAWPFLNAAAAVPGCDLLIVDRTPFTRRGRDRITAQSSRARSYRTSLPCRCLDRDSFLGRLPDSFDLAYQWPVDEYINLGDCDFYGMALRRKKP